MGDPNSRHTPPLNLLQRFKAGERALVVKPGLLVARGKHRSQVKKPLPMNKRSLRRDSPQRPLISSGQGTARHRMKTPKLGETQGRFNPPSHGRCLSIFTQQSACKVQPPCGCIRPFPTSTETLKSSLQRHSPKDNGERDRKGQESKRGRGTGNKSRQTEKRKELFQDGKGKML